MISQLGHRRPTACNGTGVDALAREKALHDKRVVDKERNRIEKTFLFDLLVSVQRDLQFLEALLLVRVPTKATSLQDGE